MEAMIVEKECPKCNVGAMEFIVVRGNPFNSNLVVEKSIFRCDSCEYIDEILGHILEA